MLRRNLLVKPAILTLALLVMMGCTKGQVDYLHSNGEKRSACQTEFTWAPEVDKYAVRYVLSDCAEKIDAQGHQVLDRQLLTVDRTLAEPITGDYWTETSAKQAFLAGHITSQEYGYLIGAFALGHLSDKE